MSANDQNMIMEAADSGSKDLSSERGKRSAVIVCWLLGNGSLLAWNSMLTIEDYYANLFPKYHPTRVLTLVYQPFAVGTLVILTYREARINTRNRNLGGYFLFFISSLALIILDLATGGKGGMKTFIGICIISAVFGIADAHVQGGMVGDLSLMCPEFIQSFFAGLAASGALTSAFRLITKAAFESKENGLRKGAMLFFGISAFFEMCCVILYAYVFPKLPIVRYYRSKAALQGSKTVAADLAAAGVQQQHMMDKIEDGEEGGGDANKHVAAERLSSKELFFQNADYALTLYLVYVLTLSIFPGFLSENTGSHHTLGTWYALVLIAIYNAWDLIGRYTSVVERLRISSRRWLVAAALSRFLFVPAFYFTGKHGGEGWMIMLTALLGITNGHLTVCIFTAAPKGYKAPEQNALGNILVTCLLGGIFSGVTLDWLWLIGKGW